MADDLATAAVFGDLTQAQAARLDLEAAGIPAFLADENMAGSNFLWSTAIGGIKLQVPASRLDEALRRLDERMPAQSERSDPAAADPGDPEEAMETDSEDDRPPEPASESLIASPFQQDLTLREQRAARLPRGVFIGFFCFPVMVLAFWRLLQVFISDERLDPPYRRKAVVAGVFIIPLTCLGFLVLRMWVCGLF